jgi:hypothetical protein
VKVGFVGVGIFYAGYVWCIRCQAAGWSTSWGYHHVLVPLYSSNWLRFVSFLIKLTQLYHVGSMRNLGTMPSPDRFIEWFCLKWHLSMLSDISWSKIFNYSFKMKWVKAQHSHNRPFNCALQQLNLYLYHWTLGVHCTMSTSSVLLISILCTSQFWGVCQHRQWLVTMHIIISFDGSWQMSRSCYFP